MFGLGITEIIIIVVILAIIFLGGQKTVDLAKTAGRISGEIDKNKSKIEKDLKVVKDEFKKAKSDIL